VVKLTLKKDGIEISAESATTGSQKTSLEAKLESSVGSHKTADLLEISFNFRFLEEFLQSIKGDSVHLGFNSSDSPGVFTDPNDKNFLHLIMPVKVEA
jgi:DNA polymerase III sliding clamp (beta) subunit (PCNA family)